MAVWDELKGLLTQLWDEHPGILQSFPDPRVDEGRQPPFRITLAPGAVTTAEDLHHLFGADVELTVGALPYPPERPAPHPRDCVGRLLADELLSPQQAAVSLDGPAIVSSGETLRHRLHIHNRTDQVLAIATNGQLTAIVIDPATGQAVGGFAGAQLLPLITFNVSPGTTKRIPLLIGTASFRPELGYTVPPGPWGLQVPIDIAREPANREHEHRLTPVLPLTITA